MKVSIGHDPVKGRGVFAEEKISKGAVIEICELLLMKINDVPDVLEGYVYQYNTRQVAIALGNGSLYNHNNQANCEFYFDHRKKLLYIRAKKDIKLHQELTINYGYSKSQKRKFRIC